MNWLKRAAVLNCFALVVALGTHNANATLIGDYVDGHLQYKYDPNMGNLFAPGFKADCPECTVPDPFESSSLQPAAVVLDPDIIFPEFIFRHLGLYDLTVDIDEASIQLSVSNNSGNAAAVSPHGFEIRLTDINWIENEVLGILTSASIVDESQFPGLSVSVINEGTGLLLDFSDSAPNALATYNDNGSLEATIVFETQPIPEPATCVLAGLGVITMLAAKRRKDS